jgi:hypothetical protein
MKIFKYVGFAKDSLYQDSSFISKAGDKLSFISGATKGAAKGIVDAVKKKSEFKKQLRKNHPDWPSEKINKKAKLDIGSAVNIGKAALNSGTENLYNRAYKKGLTANPKKEVSYTEGRSIKRKHSGIGAAIGLGAGATVGMLNTVKVWKRIMKSHPELSKKEAWEMARLQTTASRSALTTMGAGIGYLAGSKSGSDKIKRLNNEHASSHKKRG